MKKNTKKTLPKFKAVTLGADELSKAVGGAECTCGTYSVCHIDGTTDSDDDGTVMGTTMPTITP